MEASAQNALKVAEVLADSPSNAITGANRGNEDFCTLPTVAGNPNNGGDGATFDPNSGHGLKLSLGAMAAFVVSGVLLSL